MQLAPSYHKFKRKTAETTRPTLYSGTHLRHRCLPVLLSAFFFSASTTTGFSQSLTKVFVEAVESQQVVGAQLIEGSTQLAEVNSVNFGFTSPDRRNRVTENTIFCIASCSKPLIPCMIFTLVEKRQLDLNSPIHQWLAAFNATQLSDGTPTASPTLKQLLAHRAGIYSQKENPNAQQLSAIRDFRLTLSQSVNLISQQSLQSHPGSRYAYSGAGYCLIGAIAEKATHQPIEKILNVQLCKPLGMSSTTFFPHRLTGRVVATGGASRWTSPHLLGDDLQLPLVGGSIHTTALDLQRFTRMVADRGIYNKQPIMDATTWSQYVSHPYLMQRYGYGWTRTVTGNEIVLSHSGSLPPSQAMLQINLRTRKYTIALWTLANPGNSIATAKLRYQIRQALDGT